MSKEINDSTMVDVLNYSDSIVVLPTHLNPNGYAIQGVKDEGEATIETISFGEIRQANSKTNAFKTGILKFSKEQEEAVYNKLGIKNWKELLSWQEIRNIILNPTPSLSDYQKIINVSDVADFERIRGEYIMLKNTKLYDISSRLGEVIFKRYEELKAGKTRSAIKVDIPTRQRTEDEIRKEVQAETEAKLKDSEDKMAAMQAQLEQLTQLLMSQQNSAQVQAEAPTQEEKPKSNRGRKPASEKTE